MKDCSWVARGYETFQDEYSLYIRSEYVPNGELWDKCKVFGLGSKALVKYYFACITKSVFELQKRGIVHRDLKPENIILDKNRSLIATNI